jgi:hypothetical protein
MQLEAEPVADTGHAYEAEPVADAGRAYAARCVTGRRHE